jgi:molybdenum cofactor biosynthesis enzyme MoaA
MTFVLDNMLKRPKTMRGKRIQQVFGSMPHYLRELSRLVTPQEFMDWTYYKFPGFFPLRTYPSVVNFEITNECNFACPHCPRSQLNKARHTGFMSFELFEKIVNESAGKVMEMKFIGLGEPALHPDLPRMMRLLKRVGIKGILYTNGTLFEKYTESEILDWGLHVVVVSIDGTDERSFQRTRVGGDYHRIRRDIANFRAARNAAGHRSPQIEIRHVIMPNETPEMLRAFKAEWLEHYGDTVKFNLLGPPYERRNAEERSPCRDIRRETHVRFNGQVPLCGYDGHNKWIGDLNRMSVKEVWQSPDLNETRRCHKSRDLSNHPFCKTCQHR